MEIHRIFPVLSLVGIFGVAIAAAQEPVQEAIPNWPAPATWTPAAARGTIRTMSAVTSPLPFIGLTPCRIADTRGNGFTGPYGPPSLPQGSPRNFPLSGQCGIPSGASAVSLNITVTNTQGPGFISIYPQGGPAPLVSTLNYVAGQTIANAAVVPLGGGGVTVVAGVSGTDLIIDTNGYYGGLTGSSSNVFLGPNAGNSTMTGSGNTGIGDRALVSNTNGSQNTGIGEFALSFNGGGAANTAVGWSALFDNSSGSGNTAMGYAALAGNGTSSNNTAVGYSALGNYNGSGFNNTAVGNSALINLSSGIGNVAIGAGACDNIISGNDNICIGNGGVNDSNTIRIGQFFHIATYIGGIYQRSYGVSGLAVFVDQNGKLGTQVSSSRRFKQDIRDMNEDSDGLMKLRPVTFRYKPELDPTGHTQHGLIAEEVADVYPSLVVYDPDGQPNSVSYHVIPVLLLNEVQKQRRAIQELEERLAKLEARLTTEP